MFVLVCERMTGLYQWPFSFCDVSMDVPRRKMNFRGYKPRHCLFCFPFVFMKTGGLQEKKLNDGVGRC